MSWYGLATFCVAYFLAVATPGPGVAAVISQAMSRGAAGAPAFIALEDRAQPAHRLVVLAL